MGGGHGVVYIHLCVLQVLNEMFNSLHRAELGSLREGAMDPQLPQTLRVPVSMANGRVVPLTDSKPLSLVQRLFGLEVQVLGLRSLNFSVTCFK